MSTTQSRRGVPPLRNLQAILDAKATTRAQLTRRCGLSPPTIRRAIEGRAGVSAATAREVAQALGVPQQALYAELTPEELAHEARYPILFREGRILELLGYCEADVRLTAALYCLLGEGRLQVEPSYYSEAGERVRLGRRVPISLQPL